MKTFVSICMALLLLAAPMALPATRACAESPDITVTATAEQATAETAAEPALDPAPAPTPEPAEEQTPAPTPEPEPVQTPEPAQEPYEIMPMAEEPGGSFALSETDVTMQSQYRPVTLTVKMDPYIYENRGKWRFFSSDESVVKVEAVKGRDTINKVTQSADIKLWALKPGTATITVEAVPDGWDYTKAALYTGSVCTVTVTQESSTWGMTLGQINEMGPDEAGKLNRSAAELGYEALVVSNFTLYGDTRKGRRPSFTHAAGGEAANALYELFLLELGKQGLRAVQHGEFGADMQLTLTNDGPITLVLDTDEWKR